MAGFDENIVREYFELHGFLVRQSRKYQVQSRKKLAEEEIDLLVYNPGYVKSDRKANFLLFSTELKYIHRALIAVKAWHSVIHFTPTMLRNSSDILKFLEKNVLKKAETYFAGEDSTFNTEDNIMKILVLPGLPTAEPHRSESIKLLREKGVDGIISFRSMLIDILSKVETKHNYQKSGFLQVLRILKNYDLIKEPQLELFGGDKTN